MSSCAYVVPTWQGLNCVGKTIFLTSYLAKISFGTTPVFRVFSTYLIKLFYEIHVWDCTGCDHIKYKPYIHTYYNSVPI